MKLNFKFLIMGVAGIALMLGSCNKQAETAPAEGALSVAKTSLAASLLDECISGSDSVSHDVSAKGAPFSDYSKWVPGVDYTLPGGTKITFEGIYSSFIRPKDSQWYIGTAPLADCDCETTEWEDIAADIQSNNTVKNGTGNIGPDPSHNPYNVVGYIGAYGSLYNFGLGYYVYSPALTTRCIAIWKDTAGTNDQYVSNPTSATVSEAWLVRVTSLGGSGGISKVKFTYYKKL